MRKDVLLALLAEYDADLLRGLGRLVSRENSRITLLKKFMNTKEVKLLNDDDDIPFDMFVDYMNAEIQDQEEKERFFLEKYLKSHTKDAELFNKFISNNKAVNLTNIGRFQELNEDVVGNELLTHLEPKDIAALSQTSLAFYQKTKKADYWVDKFAKKGCSLDLLKEVFQSNKIKNYKKLFEAYTAFTQTGVNKVDEVWQLLCLSGDISAISHVVTSRGKEVKSKQGFGILHYVIFSNNASAIDYIMGLEIKPDLVSYAGLSTLNLIHFAARSGCVRAVSWAILICEKYCQTMLPESLKRTIEGYNVEHLAFLSGNVPTINFVVRDRDDTMNRLDSFLSRNEIAYVCILHLAARSGSVSAIERAIEFLLNEFNTWSDKVSTLFERGQIAPHHKNPQVIIQPSPNSVTGRHPYTFIPGSILHCAFLSGNVPAIERVLRLYPEFLEIQQLPPLDECRRNVIHCAAESGSVPAIYRAFELCNELSIDPKSVDKDGRNILHAAVMSGSIPAVIAIRTQCEKRNLNITPDLKDTEGRNAFSYTKDPEMIKALKSPLFEFDQEAKSTLKR